MLPSMQPALDQERGQIVDYAYHIAVCFNDSYTAHRNATDALQCYSKTLCTAQAM